MQLSLNQMEIYLMKAILPDEHIIAKNMTTGAVHLPGYIQSIHSGWILEPLFKNVYPNV